MLTGTVSGLGPTMQLTPHKEKEKWNPHYFLLVLPRKPNFEESHFELKINPPTSVDLLKCTKVCTETQYKMVKAVPCIFLPK